MLKRQQKNRFLGSNDGSLVEVKKIVFIPEKSVHLCRLGALFLGTQ